MRKFAVVMGVNRAPGATPLRFAESDAEAILAHLRSTMGGDFSKSESILLKDRDATFPYLAQILTLLPEDIDVLVFYFAGHGDDSGVMFADGHASFSDLKTVLEGTGARRKLAVLDSCGSGSFLSHGLSGFEGSRISAYSRRILDSVIGARVLVACSPDEYSHEGVSGPHGEFTAALLAACQDPSLADADGVVTADDAFARAREHLEELGLPQIPDSLGSTSDFPLGIHSAEAGITVGKVVACGLVAAFGFGILRAIFGGSDDKNPRMAHRKRRRRA